jgi:primosomal protein N' (replication factor Y) (superfamily II helicase)
VVDGLIDDGVLETVALAPDRVAEPPDPDHPHDPLSEPQAEAAARRGRAASPCSKA